MKLKNLFGMAAMAALVLSGCSNDEVVNDYSPENAIEFGTYVGRGAQSRASVKTTKELGTGFGVFAYYTADKKFSDYIQANKDAQPNFMYNEEVTAVESDWVDPTTENEAGYYSKWTYSPVKYWPNTADHKVSFFAYAPYDESVDATAIGLPPVVKFSVPSNDVKNQQDILYAEPQLDVTKKKIGEPVKFTFKHALSRIGFKVQTSVDVVNPDADGQPDAEQGDNGASNFKNDETIVVIRSVELTGKFHSAGTLTPTQKVTIANGKLEYGDMNVETYGDDEISEEGVTYKLLAGKDGETHFADPETKEWYSDEKEDTKYSAWGQNVTCTEAVLNAPDSYIMVIPNVTEKGKQYDNELTIKVVYDVVTKDANLPTGVSIVENTVTSDPFAFNFEQGKAYTFSLHLGLTSVQLSASVNGWDDAGEYSVNVPINVAMN